MIEYIKLFWEVAPEGEPSVILYEVDTENERLALRSIDIFADGRTRNIPDLYMGRRWWTRRSWRTASFALQSSCSMRWMSRRSGIWWVPCVRRGNSPRS